MNKDEFKYIDKYEEARRHVRDSAKLKGIHKEDRVTVLEVLGIFAVMVLLTIVLPTLAGWLSR